MYRMRRNKGADFATVGSSASKTATMSPCDTCHVQLRCRPTTHVRSAESLAFFAASTQNKMTAMQDRDTIDSELAPLAAAVRRVAAEHGAVPSTRLVDTLLDERTQLTELPLNPG